MTAKKQTRKPRKVTANKPVSRAFIAREGVLGWIQQRAIAHAGVSQRPINYLASGVGNVRVPCPKDHQKFAAYFFCSGQ